MTSDRNAPVTFWGIMALIFITSSAITIAWCTSMSGMGGMPMPVMGYVDDVDAHARANCTGAGASFLAMWDVMMLAMMLPSFVPMLLRYREAVRKTSALRLGGLTALVGLGYFFVWTIIGLVVFPIGVGLNAILMQHKQLSLIVPVAIGSVVMVVGLLQFTNWKLHQLACCRQLPFRGRAAPDDIRSAWKHGVHLGIQCSRCSAGLMSILLVIGMMNLLAMVVITAAISFERLAPANKWVTGTIGATGVGAGFFLIAKAAGIF